MFGNRHVSFTLQMPGHETWMSSRLGYEKARNVIWSSLTSPFLTGKICYYLSPRECSMSWEVTTESLASCTSSTIFCPSLLPSSLQLARYSSLSVTNQTRTTSPRPVDPPPSVALAVCDTSSRNNTGNCKVKTRQVSPRSPAAAMAGAREVLSLKDTMVSTGAAAGARIVSLRPPVVVVAAAACARVRWYDLPVGGVGTCMSVFSKCSVDSVTAGRG